MSGNPLALSLAQVTKRWPGADLPLLAAVDLMIQPGTTVALEAPNGAGKTTLLRIAAGLIRPDSGRVMLGPLDVEADRIAFQQRVGFLSAASAGLYARLTAREHRRFWSRIALLPRTAAASDCARVIEALSLGAFADRRVDRLSMGQRQRVRLARAFLHEPDVVLLDEPANSLDDEGVEALAREVERMRAGGRSLIWCAPSGGRAIVAPDVRLTIADGSVVAA